MSVLRFPADDPERDRFLPPGLQGQRTISPWAYLMFVDYSESDVGPYHELLFIPGAFPFPDGSRRLSISRIFVSSRDSVVNGRRNWGIPKDLATFEVSDHPGGVKVQVRHGGKVFAQLEYRHHSIGVPVRGSWIPERFRSLGQHHDGHAYLYTPQARGWAFAARCLRKETDPAVFPDVGRAHCVLSFYIPDFEMVFPPARTLPLADHRS